MRGSASLQLNEFFVRCLWIELDVPYGAAT